MASAGRKTACAGTPSQAQNGPALPCMALPAGQAADPRHTQRHRLQPSEPSSQQGSWWDRLVAPLLQRARAADAGGASAHTTAAGSPDLGRRKRRPSDFQDGDDPSVRAHWALLVAGSSGWGNYRHQADVLHAYHVLRAGGLLPERMIVMAYDDIAGHEMNPTRGKVYNRPGALWLWLGVGWWWW
jgi:hypothetical protein